MRKIFLPKSGPGLPRMTVGKGPLGDAWKADEFPRPRRRATRGGGGLGIVWLLLWIGGLLLITPLAAALLDGWLGD
jgi:hypothetical protein